MTLPLVPQRQLGSSFSPYLKSTSSLSLGQSQLRTFSLSQRVIGDTEEDAIRKSIEEKTENTEEIKKEDASPIKVGGYLSSALRRLMTLAGEVDDAQKEMTDDENDPKNSLLQEKLQKLTGEVQEIVSSDPFQKTLEALNAIQSSLQNGAISRRALSSVSSLLGDQFLDLVTSGASASVSLISQRVDELSRLSLDDPAALSSQLLNIGKDVLGRLRNAKPPKETESEKQGQGAIPIVEAPELKEVSFQAAGELALSLRAYEPKDLLRAVGGGFVSDPSVLTQLMLEPPKSNRDKNKQEENEKEQEDMKAATRNGLDIEAGKEKEGSTQVSETTTQEL